jgi:D-3-phosphoglycerate dehydrogenase
MARTGVRILITDGLNPRGLQILTEGGLRPEEKKLASEEDVCKAIGDYEGLIVRSATKVTPRVIEAGRRLRIIGRAGAGVDNINLEAATRRGIVVENTPFGNITSAAEHAVALLFAAARHVARADREMRAGQWPKKGLTGVELSGKTLGIVGLGKAGSIVARVGKALGMEILVYDPYLTERKISEGGGVKADLDALLERSDFITIHTPLTPETKNLIGKAQLAKMKKAARLVNAARGGIVSEADLAEALKSGVIAAAGLDVYEKEPLAADSPLRAVESLTLSPHLGASTEEAQERVAEDIAKQFVAFFRDGAIYNAVNVTVMLDPKIAPWARLAELLGAMAAQMAGQAIRKLTVSCAGRLAEGETRELMLSALKGLLARSVEEPVTLVNAPVIARERGMELVEHKSEQTPAYISLVTVTAETRAGEHSLAGTCYDNQEARIVGIDGLDIDLKPADHLLLMYYADQPGKVGKFGTILGEAGINIANMSVGRREKRGRAVVALTVDEPVPAPVLEKLRQAVLVDKLYTIQLGE